MDCGKENTFHKVHGFVSCFISHSDDFQGAIGHIIDNDLFYLEGKICARIKGLAFRSFLVVENAQTANELSVGTYFSSGYLVVKFSEFLRQSYGRYTGEYHT